MQREGIDDDIPGNLIIDLIPKSPSTTSRKMTGNDALRASASRDMRTAAAAAAALSSISGKPRASLKLSDLRGRSEIVKGNKNTRNLSKSHPSQENAHETIWNSSPTGSTSPSGKRPHRMGRRRSLSWNDLPDLQDHSKSLAEMERQHLSADHVRMHGPSSSTEQRIKELERSFQNLAHNSNGSFDLGHHSNSKNLSRTSNPQAHDSYSRLRLDMDMLHRDNDRMKRHNNTLLQDNKRLAFQNDDLKREVLSLDNVCKKQEDSIHKLRAKLKQMEMHMATMGQEINKAKNYKKEELNMLKKVDQIKGEAEMIKKDRDRMASELGHLKTENEELRNIVKSQSALKGPARKSQVSRLDKAKMKYGFT